VVKLVGSYSNVVGLPLYETVALLNGEGYQVHFNWNGRKAQVAQLVEQRTENPRVGGSNPPLGTILSLVALSRLVGATTCCMR
jgi:hypothetical protein